jgi:hypothetical protein
VDIFGVWFWFRVLGVWVVVDFDEVGGLVGGRVLEEL